MMTCPSCNADNIPGADQCAECGQSLAGQHLSEPATEVERSLLRDHLSALDPGVPVCVRSDLAVRQVIRLLVDRHIGSVVVVEEGRVVGIFSERDALMKLNTEAESLGHLPVAEFMTLSPRTLVATAKVAFALKEMDVGGYRHLPIIDKEGRPVGIVSVRDILHYLTERLEMVG